MRTPPAEKDSPRPDALPERGPPTQLPHSPSRPPAVPYRSAALSALRHPNFRWFWFGQLLSLTGTWMASTAQGWLVLELTDSEFLLGLVTAIGTLPALLFTLYAGVIADRRDKRRIIITAQIAAMLLALALAVLTDTGRVTIAWILLLAFGLGITNAFEIPTRQSFFVELVGKEDLTNAIALNSAAFNLTRIIGPAVAGALIGTIGIAAAFYANSVSYLAVIGGLLLIRLPRFRPSPQRDSVRENLGEGFAWIRANRVAGTLVGIIAVVSIFGLPYAMLLPVFARDVLGVGAQGLGWLLSASGAGALAGGIALAIIGNRVRRGPLLLASSVSFCLLLGGFALSRSFPLSLALLAGAGLRADPEQRDHQRALAVAGAGPATRASDGSVRLHVPGGSTGGGAGGGDACGLAGRADGAGARGEHPAGDHRGGVDAGAGAAGGGVGVRERPGIRLPQL